MAKSLIAQQKELEFRMQQTAADKYLQAVKQSEVKGSASENFGLMCKLQQYIKPLSEHIQEEFTAASKMRPGLYKRSTEQLAQIRVVPKNLLKKAKEGKLPDLDNLEINFNAIAFSSLSTLIDMIFDVNRNDKKASRETLALAIGKALQDEALWTVLQLQKPVAMHFKGKDFKEQNSTYTHMRKSLVFSKNKWQEESNELIFEKWTKNETLEAGLFMLVKIEECTNIVETELVRHANKANLVYRISDEVEDFYKEFNQQYASTLCKREPMIVTPRKWTREKDGGYIDIREPIMKSNQVEDIGNYDRVMKVINAVQETPWVIDSFMLDTIKKLVQMNADIVSKGGKEVITVGSKLPEVEKPALLDSEDFDKENEKHLAVLRAYKTQRVAKIKKDAARESKFISQCEAIRIAARYAKYDEIYFPWNLDFRGRMYPLAGVVNPQAADLPKSMIRFANSQKLNERGLYWLALNCANLNGYDKVSADKRVAYANEHVNEWREVVANPCDNIDGWVNADKPLQFLQAIKEFVEGHDAMKAGKDFYTSLAIQVDGKCNGLQHYSLMTRDEKVAPYVGIGAMETPLDIYTYVGDMAMELCLAEADFEKKPIAKAWEEIGIARKISKRPTMTCVYGSSGFGFSEQIKSEMMKSDISHPAFDQFIMASYLGQLIDKNIDKAIGNAGEAMKWLKAISKKYMELSGRDSLVWTTPMGMKIKMVAFKETNTEIKVKLGSKRIKVRATKQEKEVNVRKIQSGICPNFVHAIDSSHLQKTVERCLANTQIRDFGFIHDSFGCLANDVDDLQYELREAAIEIHRKPLLEVFYNELCENLTEDQAKELPEPPKVGTLNIEDLRDSEFFFL